MNTEIYDYMFHDNSKMLIGGKCNWTVCKNSILYRIIMDILKNGMTDEDLYSNMNARKSFYTMCVENETSHVHDVFFIMIGTKTEQRILMDLLKMLNNDVDRITCEKLFFSVKANSLRNILSGTVMSGTLYTTSFMEYRNNDIPFDHSARKERTFYLYDREYNRGHKFFTNHEEDKSLYIINRDGVALKFEEHNSFDDCRLLDYINECICSEKCEHTNLSSSKTTTVSEYIKYLYASTRHVVSLDYFVNKKYICAAESLNILLNKLNIFKNDKYKKPLWNLKDIPILLGKIPICHTYEYEKTSKCMVESTKRKTIRFKERHRKTSSNKPYNRTGVNGDKSSSSSNMQISSTGSRNIKNGETTIQRMEYDMIPTCFKPISSLHIIDAQCDMVQRNIPKNVRTVDARKFPPDSYMYFDTQCMGSINNSGKTAVFADGVKISYGYVLEIVDRSVEYLRKYNNIYNDVDKIVYNNPETIVVINKILTKYSLSLEITYDAVLDIMVHVKKYLYKFCFILPFTIPSAQKTRPYVDYLSIHFIPGIPFRRFEHICSDPDIMFTRHEIDILYTLRANESLDVLLNHSVINKMISSDDDAMSRCKLSIRSRSNGMYVLPSKQTVATNGYKTAMPDIHFECAAHLVAKNTQYFMVII